MHSHFKSTLLLLQMIVPDVNNSTSVTSVCATLTKDECSNWLACCSAARACCARQISLPTAIPRASAELNGSTRWCSRTWDGFSCFDDTPPSTVAIVPCPTFMRLADTARTLLGYPSSVFSFRRTVSSGRMTLSVKFAQRSADG